MYDLLIRDATMIRAGRRLVADIAVTDGKIVYVGDRPGRRARESVSAIGRFVMPGAIDVGVSLRGSTGEDWGSLGCAAAAAGVTTLIELTDATDPEALAAREAAAVSSVVCHGRWGLATSDNAGAMGALWSEGRICGVHTTADSPALSAHDASPALLGVQVSSPDDVSALLSGLQQAPRSLHILGVSAASEIEAIETVRGELPLTTGITPNHLFLSLETLDRIDAALLSQPPIRSELDRRAMWTAIKRGRIDCFTSGHVPAPRRPRGEAEAPGIPGIDTLLRLLMAAVSSGRMGLEEMVAMCSETPARLLGLEGKGRLEVGADADLVLFREGESQKLTSASLGSAAGWSPYTGRTLAAPPQLVVIGGRIVARDGHVTAEHPAAPVRYSR